jgi:hypothetical protein
VLAAEMGDYRPSTTRGLHSEQSGVTRRSASPPLAGRAAGGARRTPACRDSRTPLRCSARRSTADALAPAAPRLLLTRGVPTRGELPAGGPRAVGEAKSQFSPCVRHVNGHVDLSVGAG